MKKERPGIQEGPPRWYFRAVKQQSHIPVWPKLMKGWNRKICYWLNYVTWRKSVSCKHWISPLWIISNNPRFPGCVEHPANAQGLLRTVSIWGKHNDTAYAMVPCELLTWDNSRFQHYSTLQRCIFAKQVSVVVLKKSPGTIQKSIRNWRRGWWYSFCVMPTRHTHLVSIHNSLRMK